MNKDILPVTACKRHNPAAGATQGNERLHANRYRQVYETTTKRKPTDKRTAKGQL